MATKIHVNLLTSRPLNWNEVNDFNQICFIDIKEFVVAGNQVVSIEGNTIDYYNYWKLNQNFNGIYSLSFDIKENEEEHFFIESLLYLIENFFGPRGILLNGFVSGYEDVFGFYFRYNVINNSIFFDFEKLNYINQNFQNSNIDEIFQKLTI